MGRVRCVECGLDSANYALDSAKFGTLKACND